MSIHVRAAVGLAAVLLLAATGSSARAQEARELRIAKQFGISYLPFIVMEDQRLLEKAVAETGLPEPKVTWSTFSGAAPMNDALISNNLDFASAGVPPMVTVWARTRGNLRVQGVAALGSMPIYMTTNNPAVQSLKDLTDRDRIALPAIKVGFQAVLLQMAAEQAFGAGQHERLDRLTVSMPHPDGTVALLSGRLEITAHISSPPFQNQQLRDPKIRRLVNSYDVLGGPHTFNVIYATGKFRDANPRSIGAFITALDRAIDWIKANPKAAAALYIRAEKSPLDPTFVEELVTNPEHRYTSVPENTMKFAEFQYRTGQIKERPASWRDLFGPEMHDRPGS